MRYEGVKLNDIISLLVKLTPPPRRFETPPDVAGNKAINIENIRNSFLFLSKLIQECCHIKLILKTETNLKLTSTTHSTGLNKMSSSEKNKEPYSQDQNYLFSSKGSALRRKSKNIFFPCYSNRGV